MHAVDTI